MAKNISLLGADYPDVPAVQLPQTGGGVATFYDVEVTDGDPTLAWGTRSKVGTVQGTDLHVTMPANPASGMLKYKSVTIPKATAGTSWSQTSRYIGTTDTLFELYAPNIMSLQIRNASFSPAANATIGLYNNQVYVAATQSTTLGSDIVVDIIYKE